MNRYRSTQSIYKYKGLIHLPYQVSTMTIFEQYQAGVPLFFPSKQLLTKLQQEHPAEILNEISYLTDFGRLPIPSTPNEPNNIKDVDVIKFWIESADFYDQENMPHIQYFNSFDHLKQLLETVDTHEISRKMHEHNKKKKERVYNKWRQILDKVIQKMVKQTDEGGGTRSEFLTGLVPTDFSSRQMQKSRSICRDLQEMFHIRCRLR